MKTNKIANHRLRIMRTRASVFPRIWNGRKGWKRKFLAKQWKLKSSSRKWRKIVAFANKRCQKWIWNDVEGQSVHRDRFSCRAWPSLLRTTFKAGRLCKQNFFATTKVKGSLTVWAFSSDFDFWSWLGCRRTVLRRVATTIRQESSDFLPLRCHRLLSVRRCEKSINRRASDNSPLISLQNHFTWPRTGSVASTYWLTTRKFATTSFGNLRPTLIW